MKINNIQGKLPIVSPEKVDDKNKATNSKSKNLEAAAIYEKSEGKDKGHVYNKETIEELKRDSEKAYGYLRRIVEDMLRRQGMTLNLIGSDDMAEVDETARLEAQELIGPNGALGVEAVSDRLVNFAKAISGGDKSKLASLRKAIDQGFKAAEKILGKLPDISQKTYDRVMEKLDAWEDGE